MSGAIYKFIQEKFINRMRQYGFRAGLIQILRAMIRSVYQIDRDIIFVIPNFGGYMFSDPVIKPLTGERIQQAAETGELTHQEAQLLLSFIAAGCRGLCAEIDGRLAGYSWVQFAGEYRFGRTGLIIIPPKHVISKNSLVFPEYRGNKLFPKLIAAYLTLIPSGYVPLAFILPENRFSIRTIEKYGFQRVLYVKRWCWFRGCWHMNIDRLAKSEHADELEQALIQGHRDEQSVVRSS